jgi:hypothetical protein
MVTAQKPPPVGSPPPPPLVGLQLGSIIACPYASHHFFGTNFADATLNPTIAINAELNVQTGLQTFGTGGLSMFAPLGNIGWSLELRVGSTVTTQVQSLIDMQGLALYVQNGQFFLN